MTPADPPAAPADEVGRMVTWWQEAAAYARKHGFLDDARQADETAALLESLAARVAEAEEAARLHYEARGVANAEIARLREELDGAEQAKLAACERNVGYIDEIAAARIKIARVLEMLRLARHSLDPADPLYRGIKEAIEPPDAARGKP